MSAPQNEVIFDRDFGKDIRRLPAEVLDKLSDLLDILKEDPFDPCLHTKPLSAPLQGIFSFRINRDYRVGFKFQALHVIVLITVDKRDKIYQRLQRKL